MRALAGRDSEPHERVDVFLTGLAFLDIVFTGLDSPPVPGTEIWAKGLGSGPGGIANFAVALQRLGLSTSLAAAFGADLTGDLCQRMLADAGVDLSRSRRYADGTTPGAVPYPGDRALITYGDPPPLSQDELVGEPPASRAALVHLSPDSGSWIERAQAAGSLVFADVGWDPSQQWVPDELEHLRSCHAFLPNADEAMGYTRTSTPAAALSRLADLVPLAVVTCGADGAIAVDGTTGESASAAGRAVDAGDTTGAGDVFGAGLTAATLADWPLAERLRFAVLTSALSLRRPGGAMAAPGWEDIAAWWAAVRDTDDTALRRDYAFLDDVIPLRRSDER